MRAVMNDAADGPGRDIMAGIAVLEKQGFIDESRIGVSGWSYGGYLPDVLAYQPLPRLESGRLRRCWEQPGQPIQSRGLQHPRAFAVRRLAVEEGVRESLRRGGVAGVVEDQSGRGDGARIGYGRLFLAHH